MSGFFESIAKLVNALFKNVFWYIAQKSCEWTILEYKWFMLLVPNMYITQETSERAVDDCLWALKFVPDKCMTQEMCERAVGDCPLPLKLVPDWFCDTRASKNITRWQLLLQW